ncbi:MAG: hypothetical protein M3Z04_02325, partial [Chloroflexota bacterium]|nr:hypothetical protein [Chloroflexota bacterium]
MDDNSTTDPMMDPVVDTTTGVEREDSDRGVAAEAVGGAGGAVIGGVIGAVLGGPIGAAIGAGIGAAAGAGAADLAKGGELGDQV